jgi:hypothetical protein
MLRKPTQQPLPPGSRLICSRDTPSIQSADGARSRKEFAGAKGILEDFGLHFSLIHLDRIISILSDNIKTDSGDIAEQINDLRQRNYDELSSTYCIRLAKEQAIYSLYLSRYSVRL